MLHKIYFFKICNPFVKFLNLFSGEKIQCVWISFVSSVSFVKRDRNKYVRSDHNYWKIKGHIVSTVATEVPFVHK